MRIVVLDGYTLNPGDNPWTAVAALGELVVYDRTPLGQIVERAVDAEIILTNKTPLSAATLEQLPHLRFISVLATGFNIVDIVAARAHAIPVSNVPNTARTVWPSMCWPCLLHFCHQVALHDRLISRRRWQRCGDFLLGNALSELVGKRMGIIGFGRIGRRVGDLAHALGMEVLAYDVQPGNEPGYQPFSWQSIEVIFEESDVVTLHCPQTNDNVGMVNRALLSRMKPTALLINAAHGGLVHEHDLADALDQGVLAGTRARRAVLGASPGKPSAAAREELLAHTPFRLGHARSPPAHDGHHRRERCRVPARTTTERGE